MNVRENSELRSERLRRRVRRRMNEGNMKLNSLVDVVDLTGDDCDADVTESADPILSLKAKASSEKPANKPKKGHGICPFCGADEDRDDNWKATSEPKQSPRSGPIFRIVSLCPRHCSLCAFWSARESVVAEHKHTAHAYSCDECAVDFKDEEARRVHNCVVHKQLHHCLQCDIVFRSRSGLRAHEGSRRHSLVEFNVLRAAASTNECFELSVHAQPAVYEAPPHAKRTTAAQVPSQLLSSGEGLVLHDGNIFERLVCAAPSRFESPMAVEATAAGGADELAYETALSVARRLCGADVAVSEQLHEMFADSADVTALQPLTDMAASSALDEMARALLPPPFPPTASAHSDGGALVYSDFFPLSDYESCMNL